MASNSRRYVSLRGGLVLPEEALRLALDLERRGWALTATDYGTIKLDPADPEAQPLTDDDLDNLRRWKMHLLAIAVYEPPTLVWAEVQ